MRPILIMRATNRHRVRPVVLPTPLVCGEHRRNSGTRRSILHISDDGDDNRAGRRPAVTQDGPIIDATGPSVRAQRTARHHAIPSPKMSILLQDDGCLSTDRPTVRWVAHVAL